MSETALQIRDEQEKRTLAALFVTNGTMLEKGRLYLHLFHGRNTPDEKLDDWGFQGPYFGPLDYFHITYISRFAFARAVILITISSLLRTCLFSTGNTTETSRFSSPTELNRQVQHD
jgi:hypothetical protein